MKRDSLRAGNSRSQWGSSFGFIMASVGAAVGLGNIWGFPYKLGQGGGFVFLMFYLIFVAAAGFPILLAELAIGRASGRSPVLAYKSIDKNLGFAGVFSLIACFLILCYYSFFGGMLLEQISAYLGFHFASPVFWHLTFMLLTACIVMLGVENGIEKTSVIMVPLLIVLLFYICANTLRLPGAKSALYFLFKPDFDKLTLKTVSSALMQVLFSISLGQGIMITYGSYLNKKEKLIKSAVLIPLFDTGIALLAALAIMPAVFSFGVSPGMGPSMMFDVVPMVFSKIPGGNLLALLFFILVLFAAITSSVSMLETLVSSVTESGRIKRKTAVIMFALLAALFGLPVCFSYGKTLSFAGTDFFGIYEFISQYVIIIICSLITSLAAAFLWKSEKALPAALGKSSGFMGRLWMFLLKCVTPLLLVFVLISLLFRS